jgi:methylase of polypeptide subunit release factors
VPENLLPEPVTELLTRSGRCVRRGDSIQSLVRFSSLDGSLIMHSAFPTSEANSVFFGPDTYRFVRFLKSKIKSIRSILDLGCGSGAGGIALAKHFLDLKPEVHFADINPTALRFARVNAALAGITRASFYHSDLTEDVPRGCDLIIANPPFVVDSLKRKYRDGGAVYGSEISIRMVRAALDYLEPGGVLALYTGTCIVGGRDVFLDAVSQFVPSELFRYEELDPDIFGEELLSDAYAQVERIAAVGLILKAN